MNMYDKIRHLSSEEVEVAWIAVCEKGDSFHLNDEQYTVSTYTKKTFRLKNSKGKNYTFKIYFGNRFATQGKEANLLRDIEGEIIRDLINQYNPFHEPSDVFKMTTKLFE